MLPPLPRRREIGITSLLRDRERVRDFVRSRSAGAETLDLQVVEIDIVYLTGR